MEQFDFASLYQRFNAPVTAFDCGDRCAPYNDLGAPFCCDLAHAVPSAYEDEWAYLEAGTDLWRPWSGRTRRETEELKRQAPEGQVLLACKGHLLCRRSYRTITCRSFPFFPYVSRGGEFLGLSYYWEYEDRCWVISHLDTVQGAYRTEFIDAYDELFRAMPAEKENYRNFSSLMRRVFGRRGRAIPLLHRNGQAYKVTPRNGRLRKTELSRLPKFGPYELADQLKFPDEL